MKLYISAGYNKKNIPELILKNNLYGLDIDDRAGQFAIISVMLKAREYDSEIFNKIDFNSLNILSIPESNPELRQYANDIKDKEVHEIVDYLINTFENGKEIGSLLIVEEKDYDKVTKYFEEATPNIFNRLLWEGLKDIIRVSKILSKKYDVVVTNPPYMLKKNFTERLREYVEDNYNNQSSDLCTAFMANTLGNKNGYNAIINMQSWMFLQSYEAFRKEIINNYTIFSLLHLGAYAFEDLNGEVVQTVTLIYNTYIKKNVDTLYYRLVESDFKEKEIRFLKKDTSIKYLVNNSKFEKIKGYTFAYWIKDNSYNCLISNKSYGEFVDTKVGLSTGGNDYYLRAWYEIDINDFSKKCDNKKYKEYIYGGKGVEYKKWYGNRIYVINWENDGFEIKNNKKSTIRNEEYYFKETVAFSTIASNTSRWYMDNAIIDVNFRAMFVKDNRVLSLKSILALLNSIIAKYYNKIFSSTLALNVYDIERIPIINSNKYKQTEMYVNKNIELAKNYWDSFETSWDFKKHPLA
ncbi:MAG: Eco57I restriction-modification methylase domain-containing protein [Lachnospiraceae bacterium]|nr:Eco57I restriction-modification methylase domain-containing protein [Lachnospiraceae bacterium]